MHVSGVEVTNLSVKRIFSLIKKKYVCSLDRSTLESKQINPKITKYLYSVLSSAPNLISLSSEEKSGPIGSWAGRIGELSYQDFSQTLCALEPVLSKLIECTSEEYKELVEEFGR